VQKDILSYGVANIFSVMYIMIYSQPDAIIIYAFTSMHVYTYIYSSIEISVNLNFKYVGGLYLYNALINCKPLLPPIQERVGIIGKINSI